VQGEPLGLQQPAQRFPVALASPFQQGISGKGVHYRQTLKGQP
jgi:hypothetical protein